ncbi:hypothetical protein BT63DRAFT_46918 [Microthyrium microscopicum]|uniref:TUG ubiquitin-like domain-containing protein n=1 Tax=Microthyrium microscopicum TaxID=703497 RepID=A0A6A6U4F4_9PEZI|nr:hypothetical protein BT63DRAFT_46918 [Microthyrium microscopicum]
MASHVFIVDTRAHRIRVPTTPTTYLSDVLQEGCKKLGLNGDDWILKHNDKPVDLSRTIRLAGLPGGAQLQLVQGSRSPTVITVAVQLPEAEGNKRITHKFASTISIWEILRVVETQEKLNLTERATPSTQNGSGRLFYEMPTLNAMNRELGTFVDLQKTLTQIGVTSGNILLRLVFKPTEIPLEDAMRDITTYFTVGTSNQSSSITAPSDMSQSSIPAESKQENISPKQDIEAADTVMTDAPTLNPTSLPQGELTPSIPNEKSLEPTLLPTPTQEERAPAPSSQPPADQAPSTSSTAPPSITIYTPPTSSTPLAAQQPYNEADFIPTLEHATKHQARLVQETRNRRLASDAELAAAARERQAAQDAVDRVRVRVRLPDQAIIETVFVRGSASGRAVYDTVRLQMRHPEARFTLRWVDASGAHVSLPDDATYDVIVKAGWRGNVLVSMVWDAETSAELRQAPVLTADAMGAAKALNVELQTDQEPEGEKKGSFLGGLFKKEGKDKPKMGPGEKEAKLHKLLGFKKK